MAGTELSQVVDEEEEPPRGNGNPGLLGVDWDRRCSYRSNRLVRIKDKYIGIFFWAFVTAVILYMVVVVVYLDGLHMQQDSGHGTVITKFQCKAFVGSKAFDEADLRLPVAEPSGAFILMQRYTLENQRPGRCVDWENPQKCPCPQGGACNGAYCENKQWCPSLAENNLANPPAGTAVEAVSGLEDCALKFSAGVSFPSMSLNFRDTWSSPSAAKIVKSMSVKKLLTMATPPTSLAEMSKGAIISVNFQWACSHGIACEPQLTVKRLDNGAGYSQKRSRYITSNGVQTREVTFTSGLRIMVDSSGLCRTVSVMPIVVQLGSCMALLKAAAVLCDFLMLNVLFCSEKSSKYQKQKVHDAGDYSEQQDRLNLIRGQRRSAQAILGSRGRTGAGSAVQLGLGAGGRAGLGSNILRGRTIGAASSSNGN